MSTYSIEKVEIPHSDRHLMFPNQTENFKKKLVVSLLVEPGAAEPIDYTKSNRSAARAFDIRSEYQGILLGAQFNLGSSTTLVESV